MVIVELLGWAFGSIQGLATIVLLITVGRWARKGRAVGDWLSTTGIFLILLGVLALSGVLDIHADVVAGFVGSLLEAATSLLDR